MKRNFILLIITMLFLGFVTAQPVSQSEALSVAEQFLAKQQKSVRQCAHVVCKNADTLLYVYNADNAFVMIAGDKRMPPVLAFSDRQLYNDADVIPPVKMWMEQYCRQMEALKTLDVPEDPAWQKLESRGMLFREGASVAPLMKSHWGQGTFYNYYCPRDYEGENNRVVTGCVATALAQLIYYYRFPDYGIGTYSYIDSTYGEQFADYANTHYDYSAMCDEPTSINTAISTLMYHCGVGVDMVYGPDGSGMYNHSAAYVLRNYFKFSPETQYVFRDSTNLDWDSLIVTHLHRNMPLYYAGWSTPNVNGHGFICDGYRMVDSNYYYHFNFGWDGSYDSYFYTNALNLIGTHFNFAQELIVNAYPDTNLYEYPQQLPLTGTKVLTSVAGSFLDGSAASSPCRPNMDYTWIIRPQEDYFTSMTLKAEYDLGQKDTLWISCNNPSMAPMCLTQCDSLLHATWDCTEITLRLVTGDSLNGLGLRASYQADVPLFCEGMRTRTSATGTITDGSGTQNYLPFSSCGYRIVVPMYNLVQLHFEYLDLEENKDFLHVFDNVLGDENLIVSLTGTMYDTTLTFNLPVTLLFETDEQNNADGFKLTYQAGHVGVEEFSIDNPVVYPNPVEDVVSVMAGNDITSVAIYDMYGKVVREVSPNKTSVRIRVEDLPSGIYMLRVQTSGQVFSKKIIKP